MRAAALQGHATATDLADYLVRKGVAFRDAHGIVARAVRDAEASGRDVGSLSVAELKRYSPAIGADVAGWLTLEGSVSRRNHVGGTAPGRVRAAAKNLRARLRRRP